MSATARELVIRAFDADGYVADDAVIGLIVDGKDRGRVESSAGWAKFTIPAGAARVEAYADFEGQQRAHDTPSAETVESRIVFRDLHLREKEGFVEKHFIAFIGIAFILIAAGLAFVFPSPTPLQTHIILGIFAIGGGGVASEIPGLLNVNMTLGKKFVVAASGALALFVILYFVVPAGTPGVK